MYSSSVGGLAGDRLVDGAETLVRRSYCLVECLFLPARIGRRERVLYVMKFDMRSKSLPACVCLPEYRR